MYRIIDKLKKFRTDLFAFGEDYGAEARSFCPQSSEYT